MFLIIFEDGEVKRAAHLSEGDEQSAEDGYLDLIDISDPTSPKRFISGEWGEVEELDL
jgi:hypothetical protein